MHGKNDIRDSEIELMQQAYTSKPSLLTIIPIIIAVGGIIWAGSKIDTKAEIGAKFAEENKAICLQVKVIEKKIEKIEPIVDNIKILQTRQERIVMDLEDIAHELRKNVNEKP